MHLSSLLTPQAFNMDFSVDTVCWIPYYKTLSLLYAAAACVEVK